MTEESIEELLDWMVNTWVYSQSTTLDSVSIVFMRSIPF